ncbi:MAG: EamA family transporter [Breznakibacter sp.]
MWVVLAALSALFLGVYEIFKKVSVNKNAVLPVLLMGTVASTIIFLPFWIMSRQGVLAPDHMLFVPSATPREHFLIFIKTIIVLISWIFTYFALKHLPLTIVSPIRSTGPVWTLLGAIVVFAERLTPMQWAGVLVTLAFFYIFSMSGRKESAETGQSKWLIYIIIGTLAGSVSGLYNKFLLKEIHRLSVQCYFSFYQVAIMLPVVAMLWWPKRHAHSPFVWRWSIPLIGVALVVADFLYFYALSDPESLISIVSALRRGSVVVSFIAGAVMFHEKNILKKSLELLGILGGIALLMLGSK